MNEDVDVQKMLRLRSAVRSMRRGDDESGVAKQYNRLRDVVAEALPAALQEEFASLFVKVDEVDNPSAGGRHVLRNSIANSEATAALGALEGWLDGLIAERNGPA